MEVLLLKEVTEEEIELLPIRKEKKTYIIAQSVLFIKNFHEVLLVLHSKKEMKHALAPYLNQRE